MRCGGTGVTPESATRPQLISLGARHPGTATRRPRAGVWSRDGRSSKTGTSCLRCGAASTHRGTRSRLPVMIRLPRSSAECVAVRPERAHLEARSLMRSLSIQSTSCNTVWQQVFYCCQESCAPPQGPKLWLFFNLFFVKLLNPAWEATCQSPPSEDEEESLASR